MNPSAEKLELLDQQGGVFELTAALTTIGRASSNMVVVPNQYVSRKHAEVHFDGRGYILVDLGSGHGTVLNGQTLRPHQPCVLHPGDKLVLANQVSFSLRGSAIASGPSSPGAWAQAPWRHAVPQQFGDLSGQLDLVLAGLGCSIVILAFFTNWIRAGSPFADAFLGLGDLVSYEMSGLKMLVGFPDLGFPGSPVVLLVPLLAAGALALCLWRRSTTSKSARISAIVQMVLAVLGIAYMFGLLYVSKALVASAIEQTGLPGVLGDKLISFQPAIGFWLTCLGFMLVIAGAFWSLRSRPYSQAGQSAASSPLPPKAHPKAPSSSFDAIRDLYVDAQAWLRNLPLRYIKLAAGGMLALIVVGTVIYWASSVRPTPYPGQRIPESSGRAEEVSQQPVPVERGSEGGLSSGQEAGEEDPEPSQAEQASPGSAETVGDPDDHSAGGADADVGVTSGGQGAASGIADEEEPSTSPAYVLDAFESYRDDAELRKAYGVNDAHGANLARLSLAPPRYVKSGKGTAAFYYEITNPAPDDYAGFEQRSGPEDWSAFTQLILWVSSDQSTRDLVIQFGEQSGEVWRYRVNLSTFEDNIFRLPLEQNTFSIADWAEQDNGLIDLHAITYFGVFVGNGGQGSGTIYVDTVKLR